MSMSMSIERVANGWIVTIPPELSDDGEYPARLVFEGEDDEELAQAWGRLLRTISDEIGPPGDSRYSPHRVWIVVGPGDKHPDFRDTLWPDLPVDEEGEEDAG